MTIEQAMAKLQYLSYNVTLESGEQMIIIEKNDVFEVLEKVVKKYPMSDVLERCKHDYDYYRNKYGEEVRFCCKCLKGYF